MEFITTNMFVWLAAAVVLGAIAMGTQLKRMSDIMNGKLSFGFAGLAVTFGSGGLASLSMLLFVIAVLSNLVG